MQFDYVVIGAGIAGASAAYELAGKGSVALLETEAVPGYHSTGRSAALFTRNFGNDTVQRINRASYDFFLQPPDEFSDHPLLAARGALTIAPPGEETGLEAILKLSSPGHEVEETSVESTLKLAPILRRNRIGAAVYEPGVTDIDVDAVHRGYLRALASRGGELLCGMPVHSLSYQHRDSCWQIGAGDTTMTGRIVVNAAGAWADQIGLMAGARPVGLAPKRRTAVIVDGPVGLDIRAMPAVDFVSSPAYFKPEAGRIMASLGDETPVAYQDVQPEELDIAILIDWFQNETTVVVDQVAHSWAGLRSFVADEAPVVGFDPVVSNFFWLAALGGYGIMMSPALSRATCALITDGHFPADLRNNGVEESDLSPKRFLRANMT